MTGLHAITVKLTVAQAGWIATALCCRSYSLKPSAARGYLSLGRQIRAAMLEPNEHGGPLEFAHQNDGRD